MRQLKRFISFDEPCYQSFQNGLSSGGFLGRLWDAWQRGGNNWNSTLSFTNKVTRGQEKRKERFIESRSLTFRGDIELVIDKEKEIHFCLEFVTDGLKA